MSTYNFECEPIVAWLNVNQACNMRCKWCYAENGLETNLEMSPSLAKELIDISIDAGVEEFVLIGGEPTLWTGLFPTIEYIHDRENRVSVITNAFRFSDNRFWERYQDTPADSLGISIKSVSPKEFDSVTGNHHLDRSLLGIERAISYHHGGVSAVHNTLVGLDGLFEIANVCKNLGATSFQMVMCTPTFDSAGEVQLGYAFSPQNIRKEVATAADYLTNLYGDKAYFDLQLPLCLLPPDFVEDMLTQRRLQTQCHMV